MSEQGQLQWYVQEMRDLLHKSIDICQVNKFMTANSLAEQNRLFEQLPIEKLKEVQM